MYVLELGGEDDAFAAYEASCVATDVQRIAAGLATARELSDRVETLAFTHRASELLGRCEPTIPAATTFLETSDTDRAGSTRVRAVDVRGEGGIDTQTAERSLGQVLVDRGLTVDLEEPAHELRALFAADTCALGWLVAESRRGFGARAPAQRPFVQPGSMDPLLARALANVAGARPSTTILDPMCGTGGILIEAGLAGATVVGLDVQQKMVVGTRRNLRRYLDRDAWAVARGDARSLPVRADRVAGVVFDAPYGRQSKITGEPAALVEGALREASRVATRCVVVGDRPWARVAHDTGWTTEAAFQRPVHRSLTRHVVVLRQ